MATARATLAAESLAAAAQDLERELALSMKLALRASPNIRHSELVRILQDDCLVCFEKADSYIKENREP